MWLKSILYSLSLSTTKSNIQSLSTRSQEQVAEIYPLSLATKPKIQRFSPSSEATNLSLSLSLSMDTLSSPVSTFKVPGFHSTSREFHHFKTPSTSNNLPPQPHLATTTKPNSFSPRTTSISRKNSTSSFLSSSETLPLKSSPIVHIKAASGYAAALLDIAQCNNSLQAVEKDVRRFSKLLRNEQLRAVMNDNYMGDKEKGQVVRGVAEKGKFQRHLVALLKMLVDKNKVGMVSEVLEEFERIYDELSGTRVVLVSSAAKVEEDQLFGIAKRVQKLSGAMKVKVRHLIDESLPSFAAV
ncbi:hypothetical protein L1049_013468 [Liquidambar formosana]|uniref:ATP synthase delta chain, chloroplastic n=1 Tax=Liquidambar formosana TaxID=63359 RepID=A0AAP0RKE2_LIQFO